jgi:two-component system sensor histidine kinase QseC
MIYSLRLRLLVGTSLAAIVVLGLLGLSVYAAMDHLLMSDFDASVVTDSRVVAGAIDFDDDKLAVDLDARQLQDYQTETQHRYFEIWRSDGSVLARSRSLGNRDLEQPPVTGQVTQIELPDTHHARAIKTNFTVKPDQEGQAANASNQTVVILVAARPVDVHRTINLLGWMLTIFCAAAIVVMELVLLRVVNHSLRPVTILAGEIDSLGETNLTHHISSYSVPEELTPIVDKLNALLRRLGQAFSREKSFTADVAHELRTPLAGLRSTLEVCRSRPREPAAYESAMDDCLNITSQMEAMVQSLLLLARSDAGQIAIERRPVDLATVVSQSWHLFKHRANERGLKVSIDTPTPCPVSTDPDKLLIVLHNLLDNAVSYTNEGGDIRIAVACDSQFARITITNTGSLIAPEDASHLFDRFWRGDSARSDTAHHCGLGLSLSQRLMTLLAGNINIQTTRGGDFSVTITLSRS